MSHVFVSYAREDRAVVEALVAALERAGWNVWWDRELIAGHAFDERIEQALDAAACVVVVWSEHSVASRWCRVEASEGLERGVLVPVAIDDSRPPLAFRGTHTLALRNWPGVPAEFDALLAALEEHGHVAEPPAAPTVVEAAPQAGDGQPSVVVLPIRNLSRDADDAFLADGITRDLTELVSMIPAYRVVPESTAETFRDSPLTPTDLAARLGVRYVIHGGLERRGNRFRLRIAVVDGERQEQLFSKHFDASIEEFFDVQDELVLRISSAISSEVDSAAVRRLAGDRRFELDAYALIQQTEAARSNYSAEAARFIVAALEQVVERQPDHAVAHAFLGMQLAQGLVSGLAEGPREATLARAQAHLERGRRLAPQDARVLMALAASAIMFGDAANAAEYAALSMERNPSEPHTWALLGFARGLLGACDEGVALIERAEAAAPRHPRVAIWPAYRGTVLARADRRVEAAEAFEKAALLGPDLAHSQFTAASTRLLADPGADVHARLRRGLELAPETTFESYRARTSALVREYDEEESKSLRDAFAAVRVEMGLDAPPESA